MSKLNKDGLVAGSQVDFETMQRINRERCQDAKPQPKQRAGKREVHADEQQVQDTPKPTRKKKA